MATSRVLSGGRIFVSPHAAPLFPRITSVVATCQPNVTVQPLRTTVGGHMAQWLADAGEFDPHTRRPRDLAAKFDSYVTTDPADCEATFAVYTKRIPVLLIVVGAAAEELQPPAFAKPEHPLVTVARCSTDAEVDAAIHSFYTFPTQEGRIFVVEGGDGAGKQTQVGLLVARLAAEGYPTATLDYPHDAAKYGVLIREVLNGHRGPLRAVNPLVFAALYGVNREDHQPWLTYWMLRGFNVVLDRYMTANFGHQASKFDTDDERQAAIKSLAAFEVDWLDLPPAHRVIYLNLPPLVAWKAMVADTTRRALDEHEKAGLDYKDKVRRAFLWCCENLPGWSEIACADDAEDRVPREVVHAEIWQRLQHEFVNAKTPLKA